MKWIGVLVLTAGFLLGGFSFVQAETVMITEFAASNVGTVMDEDGDFVDWIEIFNGAATPVDLRDWSLSDDGERVGKWVFPSVELAPGEFLVVFASGKNRRQPDAPLHTNFRLEADGEDLFLADPNDTIVGPVYRAYPAQFGDVSYGSPMRVDDRTVLSADTMGRYWVPTGGELGLTWTEDAFDDSTWTDGMPGFGYDRKAEPTLTSAIRTDVIAMYEVNSSLYTRMRFDLSAADFSRYLRLSVRFNDGFVAWINGIEVASENATGRRYNSRANAERTAVESLSFTSYDISPEALGDALKLTDNVLAIQVLNRARTNEDLLCVPRLEASSVASVDRVQQAYFPSPSPGMPNRDGRRGRLPPPELSHYGGLVAAGTQITIASPAGGEVHYTLDGSLPTETSPRAGAALTIETTTVLRFRTFQSGTLPSPGVGGTFVVAADDFQLDSNLPVFVVVPDGGISSAFRPMDMLVLDRGENGRTRGVGEPHFVGQGAIKTRGSSTGGRAKASYAFEIRDEHGRDRDVEILGYPADSDFILYGAFNFDRCHMRNAFVYEISNSIGLYAARTQFCEVYLLSAGGRLSAVNYRGVYTFMEKIKAGQERVPIETLEPEHDVEPEVSGGYILKIDRLDPGDRGVNAGGQQLAWVEPKEREVTDAQSSWLRQWMSRMSQSLSFPDSDDPERGYRAFVNERSFIEFHMLNEFSKNPDGLVLSTYVHKPREGPLFSGPVWDFDRCLGPDDDPRAASPVGWMNNHSSGWWGALLRHTAFDRAYRNRWHTLRAAAMSTATLHGIIDRMAAEIGDSAVRDARRWNMVVGAAGFQREVDELKVWVERRLAWMDSQLVPIPEFSEPGGRVESGFALQLVSNGGELWYTLNGSDPRDEDNPSEEAVRYDGGDIIITETTRVRVRGRFNDLWSELVAETYVTEVPPLIFSELMYHPLNRTYPEFIELKNVGDEALSLDGLGIRAGRLAFIFGPEHVLEPNGLMVVTSDADELLDHYGEVPNLAGEYTGLLGNTRATARLIGPLEGTYLVVSIEDSWYPRTDGEGYSLVPRDATRPREDWSDASLWQESRFFGGTPGMDNDEVPPFGFQKPGDLDQNGVVDLIDGVALFRMLTGDSIEPPCRSDAGNRTLQDINGDGTLDLSDPLQLLNYLFLRGGPPGLGVDCRRVADCPSGCIE